MDVTKLPGLGYAVAYPFAVLGVILSRVLPRALFRIDVAKEDAARIRTSNDVRSCHLIDQSGATSEPGQPTCSPRSGTARMAVSRLERYPP